MPKQFSSLIVMLFAAISLWLAPAAAQDKPGSDKVNELNIKAMFGSGEEQKEALDALVKRGKLDVIPGLVLAARYGRGNKLIAGAIGKLTGTEVNDWADGMLWMEANPQIKAHASYKELKLNLFKNIDANFLRFLGKERGEAKNMKIRLEEIVWGGVRVDGIPSLDNPKLISAKEASYLVDDDLVFGVEINGDVRAYPLRIMGWHEMFNETIGGVPVALAYCTLCGAGILFETKVEGREEAFRFGSSGFLYRSNKLMFDRQTDSLWNQFTGEPVTGPLVNSGIKLKIRPVAITSWGKWRAQNPDTKVLSLDTGHRRNYGSGVVYNKYFSSPDLMFPVVVGDESVVKRKDYVFGIRTFGAAKAWPIQAFKTEPVINDKVGSKTIVLIGDAATRTVRAYESKDKTFKAANSASQVSADDEIYTITEAALIGPDGTKLARVPGHISYWFAWDGYLGVKSALYKAN